MMAECYGLSALHMSVTRHNGVCILFSLFAQNTYKLRDKRINAVALAAQIQPHVKSYLVVSAARGMKSFAGRAYALCELALNKGMYILCIRVYLQRTVFDFRLNGF